MVLPDPSVTITLYSPTVSGNIGENVAGASVTVTLKRTVSGGSPADVAAATTTTDSNGNWGLSLAAENPSSGPANAYSNAGYPGSYPAADQLVVHYAPPSGRSTTVPEDATYSSAYFLSAYSNISADGSTVTESQNYGGCTAVSFVIDGTAQPAVQQLNGSCGFTPTAPLTDQDYVQVELTRSTTDTTNQSLSNVTAISDVGLLGVGGAPTCSADLVSGRSSART